MKPYYQEKGIEIWLGDCREILPSLEPVDLVLTDPPYGVGLICKSNDFRDSAYFDDGAFSPAVK